MTDKPKLLTIIGNHLLAKYYIKTVSDYIYLYNDGYYLLDDKEFFLRRQIKNQLEDKYSRYNINETIAFIKDSTRYDNTNQLPYVSFNNCILNTENLTTLDHTPKLFITNKFNVKYDRTVKFDEWEDYLSQVIPDEEHLMTLQEYIGYGFIPDQRAKKLLFPYGPKNSGKSTLLNIIISFFGENNCSHLSLDQLCRRFSNFNIYGKMMNIRADIDYKVDIASVNIIKSFLGDDFIEIEQKFKCTVQYKNRAKLILSANDIPQIPSSADDSFYDKWIPINCPNTFKIKDPTFYERFITPKAKSAILNWALIGLKRLMNNKWRFTYSPNSEEIREWFKRSKIWTTVERYLSDRCFPDSKEFELKENVYKDYVRWCEKEGIPILEPNVFHKQVKNNSVYSVSIYRPRGDDGNQQYAWRGIWLKGKI